MLLSVMAVAQDNPYALFGYKTKTVYKTEKQDEFRIKNANPNCEVKIIVFDRAHHLVRLLDKKDSVITTVKITDDQLLRWVNADPASAKYPELSPYNYVTNNPIKTIDPDGKEPIVTVTTEVIGTAQQRVLGFSNALSNPSQYAMTTVNVYKVIVTDSEDANFHMEFGVTRDAFSVSKGSYADAYMKNGNGDGPRTASNIAFEPQAGSDNSYEGHQQEGGYPKGAAAAMYLTTDDGSTKLPSAPRPGAVAGGYSKDANSATGVLFHVGGWYDNAKGNPSLAASEACFGIVNPGNSKTNPSNNTVNSVLGSIFAQAAKSQNNPGQIQVVIDPRSQVPASRTVKP